MSCAATHWQFSFLLLVAAIGTVACRPAAETPSDSEPLSVADGYIHFSVANDSRLREKSRKAFESLISEPTRQEFSSQENIIFRPHTDLAEQPEKKERKPGHRKSLIEGRSKALLALKDPLTRELQRCESTKIKQRVKAPGCLTKVIVNRYCHGTCASYFIPRLNSKKLKAVFKSCAACIPRDYDAVNVTLDCPGQDPPQITKSIVKIKKCECIDLDLSTHLRI
ncbi:hypothetical protein Q1695_003957 [Nippostrongylus brasiliensis]|nr:hypothetical protein Q1695_003957 [Nippostrongylus brasiliensis]